MICVGKHHERRGEWREMDLDNVLYIIREKDVADHSHAEDVSLMKLILFYNINAIENINGRANCGKSFVLESLDGRDSTRELLGHKTGIQVIQLKDLKKACEEG
jgi:hypothetical protein